LTMMVKGPVAMTTRFSFLNQSSAWLSQERASARVISAHWLRTVNLRGCRGARTRTADPWSPRLVLI
jgi:hypothetical protein